MPLPRPLVSVAWAALLAACALVVASPIASADTIVKQGAITAGDPYQQGRLEQNDPPSTCLAPTAASGPADTNPRRYDSYSFKNYSSSSQCITVELDNKTCAGGAGGDLLQSAAYSSYNPDTVLSNYLGDIGALTGTANTPKLYSFNRTAGANFVVVVSTANSGSATCPGYTLTVSSNGSLHPPISSQPAPQGPTIFGPIAGLLGGSSAGTARVGSNGVAILKTTVDCTASSVDCPYKDSATIAGGSASSAISRTKRKRIKVGRFKATVKRGKKARVKVRLSKTGRRLLRRRKKLKARVAITVSTGGTPVKKTVKVTFKSKKRKRGSR